MGNIWKAKHFLIMCIAVVTVTSFFHMIWVFVGIAIFKHYQMTSPGCTLSIIVVIMLMGIRQNFFESKLVTPIPVYENNLKIPFKVLTIYSP